MSLFIGVLGTLGSLVALCVALRAGISAWTVVYLVSLLTLSLALTFRRPAWRRWLIAIGGAALLGSIFARRLAATPRDRGFSVVTLPAVRSSRFVDSLLPERDGALLASAMLHMSDGGEPLDPVLREAYARMDRALGYPATPAIGTYLGLQNPRSFDTILIEPSGGQSPGSAVLFLHGFSGNFDVYCWHLSLAARASNTLVVCPSVGPRGDWWTSNGLATVKATIGYLHARGIQRIHLAGLSNGARGAAVLAPALGEAIESLILISGASPEDPPPGLPVLVIQGERDTMMPPQLSFDYVSRASGPHAYVPLPGGHFIFLSRTEAVTGAIASWLAERADSSGKRTAPVVASNTNAVAPSSDPPPTNALRDGDIIFQRSDSRQSDMVRALTRSEWTHMGVIFIEPSGPTVLEAISPVRYTDLADWVARGRDGRYAIKRLRDPSAMTPEAIHAMRSLAAGWLGRPYDLQFRWSDDALYCSELVYKLFERGSHTTVGRLERAEDMNLTDPRVQSALSLRFAPGKFDPAEPVVTPRSIFEDEALVNVQ